MHRKSEVVPVVSLPAFFVRTTISVHRRSLSVLESEPQLDVEVLRLSEYQQRVLLRAMDAALNFAKRELLERYPEVGAAELDGLVAEGLFLAKSELMAESDESF